MNQSDQIGIEEIKRRVEAAVDAALESYGSGPCGQKRTWTMRELAAILANTGKIDQELAGAVQREGLVRIVRRIMRAKNKAKQGAKTKAKKGGKK